MALVNINGHKYEAGASVIHPRNMYMVNFTKQFGLGRNMLDGANTFGLYSMLNGLYFYSSPWSIVSAAKLFWRFGWDVKRLKNTLDTFIASFCQIYDIQNDGMAFSNLENLLFAMGEEFVNYTRVSGMARFKEIGFSDAFINQLLRGSMKNNYGQDIDVHALSAAVSMAGSQSGLWSVEGGNRQVAEHLLKASSANHIKGRVTGVLQLRNSAGSVFYRVQYDVVGESASTLATVDYDMVIVATPVSHGSKYQIHFEDFHGDLLLPKIPYHTTEVIFVSGLINASQFGFESAGNVPDLIISTDSEVFFNSVGRLKPAVSSQVKDERFSGTVWKMFSDKVPEEGQLRRYFTHIDDLHRVSWLAYPNYSPGMELPPFILADGLYYISSIEVAASAMEMSVIGARNVALLAYNHWFGFYDRIDEYISRGERNANIQKSSEL